MKMDKWDIENVSKMLEQEKKAVHNCCNLQ